MGCVLLTLPLAEWVPGEQPCIAHSHCFLHFFKVPTATGNNNNKKQRAGNGKF